ncbi:MAG: hypothetical protein O7A63_07315, partial [Acidobacteria bacterium]|nr:hypothetical protein [Acidobacteriota bacterium]
MTLGAFAAQTLEVIDEENTVQVIELVAGHARQEIFGNELESLSFEILRAHMDLGRSVDLLGETGNRKASFGDLVAALFGVDHRIDQRENRVGFFAARR